MKKPELVNELTARTGFYKYNMKEVVDVLADIVEEHFMTATFEEPAEMHIAPGVIIAGRRVPEREAKDPRTGEMVMSPEKVIPYATFKPSIRKKLYVQRKKGKRE